MLSCNSVMFYLFLVFNTTNLEHCQHAFKMPNKKFPTVGEPQDHNVGVVELFGVLVDLFESHVSSRVEGDVMEDHH